MIVYNQIICGDSKEVLKDISDNSVDIILTSPPYNFDMEYDSYNDSKSEHLYFSDFLYPILEQCYRVLKSGGRLIINIQPMYRKNIPTHHCIANFLTECGMIWRNEIVWYKQNIQKLTAWGSWKSPSCPYLNYPFEFIEVFSKDDIKHNGKKEDIDITREEFIEYVNGVWNITSETRMKKFGHPAMFPEELVYRCLKLFSYKNDLVLDPFNGAGTTTYVSNKLNRRYIGIDISEEYCKIAKERIENVSTI